MQTMIEKLRLIANGLALGKVIQFSGEPGQWIDKHIVDPLNVHEQSEYRIKPDNPRLYAPFDHTCLYVQYTPEVKEALKAAGIEVGE
jgi:hypothetical protein